MDAAKSKLENSGLGQNATVHVESDGKTMKVSVDTTNAQGQPIKFTYQAPLDGKPGTVSGSPTFDEISIERVNDHTLSAIAKKSQSSSHGPFLTVVFIDQRVVSGDGKTMTIARTGTNAQGQEFHATMVFDRQ